MSSPLSLNIMLLILSGLHLRIVVVQLVLMIIMAFL